MKRKLYALLLVVSILLCACGTAGQSWTSSPSAQQAMADAWTSAFHYELAPVEITHGEDYRIEWEDAGMEAHVRLWLDRPEGDIYHSDVWDLQMVRLGSASDYDFAIAALPEGWEAYSYDLGIDQDQRISHGLNDLPQVETLRDLRHFDSLQILQIGDARNLNESETLELSGVEDCLQLKVLWFSNRSIVSLAPLAELTGLQKLSLSGCAPTDLTPIAGLTGLSALGLSGTPVDDLTPLRDLTGLRALALGGAPITSLEALAGTNVEYLNMTLGQAERELYSELDYEPLTRMENLVYLDLTRHSSFDITLCNELLSSVKGLRYLDVSYTAAAADLAQLTAPRPEFFLAAS